MKEVQLSKTKRDEVTGQKTQQPQGALASVLLSVPEPTEKRKLFFVEFPKESFRVQLQFGGPSIER